MIERKDLKKLMKEVQGMSSGEIIITMIEAIRNPVTQLRMYSFGRISEGICIGCAAANFIIKTLGMDLEDLKIDGYRYRKIHPSISNLENAIDLLRLGRLDDYNWMAETIDMSPIINPNKIELPSLGDNFTEKELRIWEKLAKDQK